ncbi:MAG: hypothetical protein DWQ02_03655 [Bacteroidetes bacterium]|nr:MAG: hypothetical protein DWQ02_03655 [Bacteroidota bacterium]
MLFGTAWWFFQPTGWIKTLSNLDFLSPFVGIWHKYKSILSLQKHKHFSILICNIFGQKK